MVNFETAKSIVQRIVQIASCRLWQGILMQIIAKMRKLDLEPLLWLQHNSHFHPIQ